MTGALCDSADDHDGGVSPPPKNGTGTRDNETKETGA